RRPVNGRVLPAHDLCRGPGNVTMAMVITLAENQTDLLGDRLFIEDRGIEPGPITWSTRIGIRVGTDRLWRAYLRDCPAVSGRYKSANTEDTETHEAMLHGKHRPC